MSTILDATVRGGNANSYVASVSEALAILDPSPYRDAFIAAEDVEDDLQVRLLVRARQLLDTLPFDGEATDVSQALMHPRTNMEHPSGWVWDWMAIASPVKWAQCEIAAWLASLSDPGTADLRLQGDVRAIASVTAGPVTVRFRDDAASAKANDFLANAVLPTLVAQGICVDGGRVRLVR